MRYISPKVEKKIVNDLDFRFVIYAYMYQHPEATKASIAERLGIAPITLSRAIAAEKKGIDKALVPGVVELLHEIRFDDFSREAAGARLIYQEQYRHEVEIKAIPILCKYFDCKDQDLQTDVFPHDGMLVNAQGKKIYVNLLCGRSFDTASLDRFAFSNICRVSGAEKIVLLCDTKQLFKQMTSPSFIDTIERFRTRHYVTAILFDLEKGEVVAEYIVHDPENEFRAGYELSDKNEET